VHYGSARVIGLRSLLASARRAPWGASAPLAIVMSVVLAVGLVVADGGGWRTTLVDFGVQGGATYLGLNDGGVIYGFAFGEGVGASDLFGTWTTGLLLFTGALVASVCALLVVLAASRDRRLVVVVLVVLMALGLVGWTDLGGARLGYTTVVLEPLSSQFESDGQKDASITMSAVVALLVGMGLVVALWWAVAGSLARRRGTARPRPTWARSLRWIVLAIAVALPLPRLGLWLRDVGRAVFDTPASALDGLATGSEQTVYLFVAAALVLITAGLVLPHRAPAAALACVIVTAATWMPVGWLLSAVLPEAILDSGVAVLMFWAIWVTAGIAGLLTVAVRCAANPQPTPA
jgi:hypothetical protein